MNSTGQDSNIELLVIGFGNTLRADDGAGPLVADAIQALNLAGVSAISCGLLTPELAEPLSRARLAIFVDAALDAAFQVRLEEIEPAASAQILAHSADARTLLALARDVFGHVPSSWLLTIPARNVGIGDNLSAATSSGVREAVERVKRIYFDQRGGG
ncbi:MAG TPA: hydrogenase maturation protease [Verrucomicrobiae bacterium]|jgi:hydrogenase maturation protease|nr:hydrogenase maturation protease [Verrucomicrobiae bacterium]